MTFDASQPGCDPVLEQSKITTFNVGVRHLIATLRAEALGRDTEHARNLLDCELLRRQKLSLIIWDHDRIEPNTSTEHSHISVVAVLPVPHLRRILGLRFVDRI